MSEGLNREVISSDAAEDTAASGYTFPEEFQEKGWTKTAPEFKDMEEANQWLVKQYDSNQEYVSGRLDKFAEEEGFIKPPSADNPEEINALLSKYAPQDAAEYKLNELYKDEKYEMSEDASTYFSDIFKSNSVTTSQAKGVLEGFKEWEIKQFQAAIDPADYEKRMTEVFGRDFQKEKQPIDNMLKSILPEQDLALINSKMPNEMVEMMYRVAKGVHDKYGFEESSAGGAQTENAAPGLSKEEKDAKYDELYKKRVEMDKNPGHTQEDINELLKEMQKYV